MRKILITFAVVLGFVVAMGVLWLFAGRHVSLLIDQFISLSTSQPIKSLVYEGNGTGGVLQSDGFSLSLNNTPPNPQPNIGTTKDKELALSFGGKVFPFGLLKTGSEVLECETPPGDNAAISIRHSVLSWPTALSFNFMTGKSPSWKRNTYRQLTWTKPSGAKLEMVWRYEQHFLPGDGWTEALMIGNDAPGLIRVDISSGTR